MTSPTPPRHHRGALFTIAAAQLMVMLDLTIVNVALPSIQHDLHFSSTTLTWVIDAYVLVFGGLLILGGRSGDIFGRRRMFSLGIGLFALASLLGGIATDQAWLIAARALQGVGAAIASPTALALIATTFDEGHERNRAMAVYAGMTAAGGALGLISGGALVEAASWRWVFWVNVPIALVVLISTSSVLPASRGVRGRLDVPGALSGSLGVASIVYALVRAPSVGWGSTQTWGALVLAGVLLGAFGFIETRAERPLVRLSFLRHRNRAGGYIVMMLFGGAMLSLLFFLTQFLQEQMHYSSLRAGVSYLPVPFMVATTSVILSKRIRHVGLRPFLVAGPLLVGAGVFWASLLQAHDSYWHVLGPLATFGLGAGLSVVPLTLNAVSSVADHEQGLASSLLNTSQQIGGSLGLAVLVTIEATTRTHDLARGLSNTLATTDAMHQALRVAAGGAFLAFVVAALVIRAPRPSSPPSPQPVAEVLGQA